MTGVRRPARRAARAPGFTLIEVMVALAIAGIVVLLAHRLFAAATAGASRLLAERAALDREANARRWLQAAFLSTETGRERGDSFEGRPDVARFSTWLETAGGWFERRRVTLAVNRGRLVARVVRGGAEERIVLADGLRDAAFDYMLEPGARARWVREWVSPVSAPLAVRLRIAYLPRTTSTPHHADTLLLLIKERG